MIACPTSYEVYRTTDLSNKPYALENSGQSIGVLAVKNSLETGKNDRITFVQN
jgi:hypothetical protein